MQFVSIEDKYFKNIYEIQRKTNYNGCEFSQFYIKNWDFFNFETMEICLKEDIAFLRFKPNLKYYDEEEMNSKYIYLPPMCELDKVAHAYSMIKEQTLIDEDVFVVISTPQEYLDRLDLTVYRYEENRDYDEYLYSPKDLIDLTGKKYHAKKNFVNRFNQKYQYVFRDYQEKDYFSVLKLYEEWKEEKKMFIQENNESSEYSFLIKTLKMYKSIDNAKAGVLEIDGKIVGFELGEISPSNVGIVHIEKADYTYQGIYQALNNLFVRKYLNSCRIINRQEDIGIEGLRKSKLSYNPIGFCRKYYVYLK